MEILFNALRKRKMAVLARRSISGNSLKINTLTQANPSNYKLHLKETTLNLRLAVKLIGFTKVCAFSSKLIILQKSKGKLQDFNSQLRLVVI